MQWISVEAYTRQHPKRERKKVTSKRRSDNVKTVMMKQGRLTTFDDESSYHYKSVGGRIEAVVSMTGEPSRLLPDKSGDLTMRTRDTLEARCVIKDNH